MAGAASGKRGTGMKIRNLAMLFCALVIVTASVRAEPTGSQKQSIIDEVKDMYVCPNNNMYLSEADAAGAVCPEGTRVLKWVERMVAEKWAREDILALVSSLKMGKPLVAKNGQPECNQKGKVKVEAFIMSYCPYGIKYVTDTLVPMVNELGDSVDYEPYFIMQKTPDGKFNAMHGQKEADENLRMICLREKWGNKVWLKYTECFGTEIFNNRQAPKDWSYCAEQAGVKPAELDACFKEQSASMAEEDMKLSAAYAAYASPTAVYNCGSNIVGAIPFSNIKGQVCRLIPDPKPASCTKK